MKAKLNPKDYVDIIKRFNPFGFRDDDNKSMVFMDYSLLYYWVMETLITAFPRGYIDLTIFIMKAMKITLPDAERIFKAYFQQTFKRDIQLIDLWDEESKLRNDFLKNLLVCFHQYSNSKFSNDYFLNALNMFNVRNRKLKVKVRTEDGSIIGPVAKI